ncbi:alkaline phosphatase [Strongylocentrotus purpuratus]|uniref:alkaline phosphatase n=1 Tax=Strongylocentrotus purpuratus TaxID=7668 RepID=A0A7M7NYW4_STRPU|nr:alkaline phosphatase [Strongylocentrotus purpuratus]
MCSNFSSPLPIPPPPPPPPPPPLLVFLSCSLQLTKVGGDRLRVHPPLHLMARIGWTIAIGMIDDENLPSLLPLSSANVKQSHVLAEKEPQPHEIIKYLYNECRSAMGKTIRDPSPDFWNSQARSSIEQALGLEVNTKPAKNVIVFVGDGMDVSTVVSSRIRQGQQAGVEGVSNVLAWDAFPHGGLVKTYSTDAQAADSASTSTAIFGGVKTKDGVLGLDDDAKRGDCASATGNEVASNLHLAHAEGKATGFVTSDSVTGATVAALYAHSPERDWQSDADIPRKQEECNDLAYQLIMENDFINVILGGGRQEFLPTRVEDPEYYDVTGRREDGNNLIGQWQGEKEASSSHYVWNKEDFDNVEPTTTDYLLGLFEPGRMQYGADRAADGAGEPSLAEMTEKAIKVLGRDEDGFFLVVESALIDFSHHAGRANDALAETIELADAVDMATQMTDPDSTLIVVTSDHAHTMGIMGYPSKDNPILGIVDDQESADRLPYTTLTYLNGPGGVNVQTNWANNGNRRDYSGVDTESRTWQQDAIIPLEAETHGGADVPVYAQGPWSHIFAGVHEQNYIAHAVRHAACLDAAASSACDLSATQDDVMEMRGARPAYQKR